MRTKSKDSKSTFCTIEGCGKPRRARMLCVTHYNAQYRKPNPTAEFVCPACESTFTAERARANRYENLYCSTACRDDARRQSWPTTRLPADHWARWFGATCRWTAPVVRNTGECAWCGKKNDRELSAAYCSNECKIKAKRVRRRGREHDAPGAYTWSQVVRLWMSCGKACAYCHTPTPLHRVDPDHVLALSRGGHNGIGNILPSCKRCNSDKRDLTLSEWAEDRARRNATPVQTVFDTADPRYRHLTTRSELRLAA